MAKSVLKLSIYPKPSTIYNRDHRFPISLHVARLILSMGPVTSAYLS